MRSDVWRPDCQTTFTMTELSASTMSEWHFIEVKIPRPFTEIHFVPTMAPVEFLTYLLSCFGTWFGVSVIGLYPNWLLRWILKRSANDEAPPASRRPRVMRSTVTPIST